MKINSFTKNSHSFFPTRNLLCKNKMEDSYLLLRYLENLCGNELKNYACDKDFRRWIHKSLYYAQCYRLTKEGKALIADSFEAYQDGPMIHKHHDLLKQKATTSDLDAFDSIVHCDLLDAIAIVLDEYSGDELVALSHESKPYMDTLLKKEISVQKMKDDFGKIDFEKQIVLRIEEKLLEIRKKDQELDTLLPEKLFDSSIEWETQFVFE